MAFSNRIQQVSYDNFIRVNSAFCLQQTQNCSALREFKEREVEDGESDGARERARGLRLAHY